MAVKTKKQAVESEVLDIDNLTTKYVYLLQEKNEPRGMIYHGLTNRPVQETSYKPWQNLLLRSSILWKGGDDPFTNDHNGQPKKRRAGKYLIQYYDGCTTLFMDDQPKERETINKLVESTRQLVFQRGRIEVYGYDTMLKNYMDWCSYNSNSPYRVPTVQGIFYLLNPEMDNKAKSEAIDNLEKAMQWAKEATDSKMIIHARYLGIPEEDERTNNALSMASIRTLYREFARNNPDMFNESFTDNSIEIKYWIEKALDSGEINTTNIPNKAVWQHNDVIIGDVSGLKSRSGISTKLFELSQSVDGEEFVQQLKALYN